MQISVEVVRNPHQLRGTETALTVNCPRQRVGRHPDSSSHTPLLAPRNQTCYTVANRVVHLVDRTGILGKSQYRALRRLHQLGAGDSKHLTWPHYVIALYRRLACPVHLLVLCPTTTVARWAATPSTSEPEHSPQPSSDPTQSQRSPSRIPHENCPT